MSELTKTITLHTSPASRALDDLHSSVTKLRVASEALQRVKPTQFQSAMQTMATAVASVVGDVERSLRTLETSVSGMQDQLRRGAQASGRAVGQGLVQGIKEGQTEVLSIVKAQATWLQAAYEEELRRGVKFNLRDLIDFKTWGVSVGADAKAAIQEGMLRVRSASKMSLDETRLLLGMPSRDDMKSFAAALKSQMQDDLQATALRVRSASKMSLDETRLLLGMPSAAEVKSAKASAEVFSGAMKESAESASSLTRRVQALNGVTAEGVGVTGRLTGILREHTAHANDLHSAYRGLASGFGAMWLTWGNALPLLAGAAVSNSVMQVVKMGAQVDNALQSIRVLSQESGESVEGLKGHLLDLARNGPFGPLEVAEAMRVLSMAGLDAAQVGASIKDVLNLAVAGNTSIAQSADVMVSVATAFGIAAEGYNYIGDVIAKTAAVSKASVESIGEAFKTASVIHKQYGASLEDVGVGLAALSNLGIQGSAAGTALRNMYADLSGRSEKATAALKKFNLDLRNQYGGFKDVITVAQEFDKVLSRMDPRAAKDYIHTVFSERGSKPFIELLDQARKQVDEARKAGDEVATVYSKLEEMRDRIANSAGFAAISAAQMAMTPLNQLKATSASLQATLVETFESVAPTLVAVGEKLRTVFASDEFKDAIRSITVAVGDLTKFLVDNLDAIVNLGKAYLAFKVLQGTGNLFSGLTAGAAAAAGQIGALAGAVKPSSNAFSGLGVTTASTASALGGVAGSLTRVAQWIPVVGNVVQVAAGGWMLYEMYSSRAKASQDSLAASTSSDTYLDKLRAETARLEENTAALVRNISVSDLRAEKDKEKALQGIKSDEAKALADAETKLLKERKALADFDNTEWSKTGSGAKSRIDFLNKVAQAEDAVGKVRQAQYIAMRDRQELEARAVAKAALNADQVKKRMEADLKANAGTLGGIGFNPDKSAERVRLAKDAELTVIKDALSQQESVLKNAYENQKSLLDNAHKNGLVSEGTYQVALLTQAAEYESKREELRARETAAYYAAAAKREQEIARHFAGRPKEMQEAMDALVADALKFEEHLASGLSKDTDDAVQRRALALQNLAGATVKATKDLDAYILKMGQEVTAGQNLEDARRAMAGATDEQRAAYEAAVKFEDRHAGALADLEKKLAEAEATALDYAAAIMASANPTQDLINGALNAAEQVETLAVRMERFREALASGRNAVANNAVAKVRNDLADKLTNEISGKFADALLQGGKDGWKPLRKFLQDELLRKPFKMLIEAAVKPFVSGAVNSFLGGGSGGSGASALGTASNLSSLMGGFGAFGAFGGAASAGFGMALNGGMGLALEGGMAMLGSASGVSSAMAGLGQISGALGHIALGVAAVVALAKSLDDSGTIHTGASAQYSAAGGLATSGAAGAFGTGFGEVPIGEQTQTLVAGLTQSIVGILDSTATAFGKTAGYTAATSFADDTSKDGAWGALLISKMGETLVNWEDTRASKWTPKSFSDGEAGRTEYLAAVSADVRTALESIGLPGWAQGMLDKIGDAPSLEQLAATVTQINATQTALARMGLTLQGFDGLGDAAISALIAAAGGIEALGASASAYYDNFYSESEKAANVTRDITAAIGKFGLEMPTTREGFRALVEQQVALGEAGAPAVATLLAVSGAFASVVPAASAAEDAVGDVTEEIGDIVVEVSETLAQALERLRNPVRTIEDIAGNIISLEQQLYQVQNAGNTEALRAAELTGLTDVEIALQQRIWTLQDEATAMQAAADAAEQVASAAAQAAQALDSQRASLEQQILQLTGDTTAIRAAELAALDASLRPLQERIYALQDEAAAAAEAERAAQDMANAMQAIASERTALEREWLNVTGDTAALRALELSALDESNRALQEQIWAYLDAQSAAEAASAAERELADEQARQAEAARQAAQAVASERLGLQKQLWELLGDEASLRAQVLAELDPSNRALQEQIWALQDQKKAADEATAAAEQLASAWKNIADGLISEAQRIRGVMADSAGDSLALLQAQFALTTAQARAGDQTAAGNLADLARSLETAALAQSATLADALLAQARIASSLEATAGIVSPGSFAGLPETYGEGRDRGGIPRGDDASGTLYVYPPSFSSSNAATPAASMSTAVASGTAGLEARVQQLNERMERLQAALEAVAINTNKSARIADKWDVDGLLVKGEQSQPVYTTAA